MPNQIVVEFFPSNLEYGLFNSVNFSLQEQDKEISFTTIKELTDKIYKNNTKQKIYMNVPGEILINQFVQNLVLGIKIDKIYYKTIYGDKMVELNQPFLGNIMAKYIFCIKILYTV